MDVSVFGSFSSTSFIDLANAHVSSWHTNLELIELHTVDGKFVVVTRANGIVDLNRKYQDSYLLGVSWDANTPHSVVIDINDDGDIIINEEFKVKKHLTQFEVLVNKGEVVLYTSEKNHLYVDDYLSLSSIPLNNFFPLDPMVEYNVDIHEVLWKSFGKAEGYGSRNRIKKELYPRYRKKEAI